MIYVYVYVCICDMQLHMVREFEGTAGAMTARQKPLVSPRLPPLVYEGWHRSICCWSTSISHWSLKCRWNRSIFPQLFEWWIWTLIWTPVGTSKQRQLQSRSVEASDSEALTGPWPESGFQRPGSLTLPAQSCWLDLKGLSNAIFCAFECRTYFQTRLARRDVGVLNWGWQDPTNKWKSTVLVFLQLRLVHGTFQPPSHAGQKVSRSHCMPLCIGRSDGILSWNYPSWCLCTSSGLLKPGAFRRRGVELPRIFNGACFGSVRRSCGYLSQIKPGLQRRSWACCRGP